MIGFDITPFIRADSVAAKIVARLEAKLAVDAGEGGQSEFVKFHHARDDHENDQQDGDAGHLAERPLGEEHPSNDRGKYRGGGYASCAGGEYSQPSGGHDGDQPKPIKIFPHAASCQSLSLAGTGQSEFAGDREGDTVALGAGESAPIMLRSASPQGRGGQ